MTHYKIIYSNHLSHHGILGQKWGKRNGPPYPLGSSDHSSSEKKAGWRNSLNKENGSKRDKRVSFKLTDKQKKCIKIGLAVGAACLLVYGVVRMSSGSGNGEMINLLRRGKNKLDLHYKSHLKYIKGEHSRKQDLKLCNENWDPHDPDMSGNCAKAVFSYVLRRLGFDVTALGGKGMSARMIDEVFHGSLAQHDELVLDRSDPKKQISNWVLSTIKDERAIGYFGYDRVDNAGHYFIWEKIGNKVILRDAQTGGNSQVMRSIIDELKDSSKTLDETIITRLDNCRIDPEKILQHVKNRI